MKLFTLIFLLFLSTCSESHITHSTADCGNAYSFSDAYFDPNEIFYAKIRFVFMQDTVSREDSNLVAESIDLLNTHLLVTKKQFLIGSIEVGGAENKSDMPYFRKYAKSHNKDGVFNFYIYDNTQEDYSGDRRNIKGEVGSIPGKTVAIRKQFLNSSTISHETAHLLGCHHIQTYDSTDGLNIEHGDFVCDIRSIADINDYVNEQCKYIGPERDTSSVDKFTDYTCNLMSYTYDKCRSCLSDGQVKRINFIVQNNEDLKKIFGIKTDNL